LTIKRFGRKLLKLTGILIGIVLLLLLGFHIWFVYRAKSLMEETVYSQTNGKIRLKIDKLHYNYFSRKMVLENAVFVTTDTLTAPSGYRFAVPQLQLHLQALLPLVFQKKLLIDSLLLQSPDIRVTTLRYPPDTSTHKKEKISIPNEMGKIYKSIRDGLQVLKVVKFRINDGTFNLVNRASPDQLPMRISRIQFQVDNLRVDDTPGNEDKILFSDNVQLQCSNQHIVFPDGHHHLDFRDFRIDLKKQLVVFDSCTIGETPKDSSGSRFRVFFRSLALSHIDFDTLYRADVIKADSVYGIDPAFYLSVNLNEKKNGPAPPSLKTIIEQLTGDMQLGHVGVINGDFSIQTTRNGKPSSFVSKGNTFEMEGLQVIQEAKDPIRVKKFAMAIRNYENFIRDSSYRIQFDSILFRDAQITLSRFLFQKLDKGKVINTIRVPRFSLGGLSWDALVFDRRLQAHVVSLYQPSIQYTATGNRGEGNNRPSVFHSLGLLNEYMDLDELEITDGMIDLRLQNNIRVQLQHANFSVQSNALLASTRLSGIRNSLNYLDFSEGLVQAGTLTVKMNNIRYPGTDGKLDAASLRITDPAAGNDLAVTGASVKDIQVDEKTGHVFAEGIRWQQASLALPLSKQQTKKGSTQIDIRDIYGTNTHFRSPQGHAADLQYIWLEQLLLGNGTSPLVKGLRVSGHSLVYPQEKTTIRADSFDLADQQQGTITNFHLQQLLPGKTITAKTKKINLRLDIAGLLERKPNLGDLVLDNADISIQYAANSTVNQPGTGTLPSLSAAAITLNNPSIRIERHDSGHHSLLEWNLAHRSVNRLRLSNVIYQPGSLTADAIFFRADSIRYYSNKGRTFTSGKGILRGELEAVHYAAKPDENPTWKAMVKSLTLQALQADSLGKRNGKLEIDELQLNQLMISDENILNWRTIAAENENFILGNFTGRYLDSLNRFSWSGLRLNRTTDFLAADSFTWQPAMSLDSFIATRKYQQDYSQLALQHLAARLHNNRQWIADSTISISRILIDSLQFSDYKDRRLPFRAGIIKPLPVDLLRKLPFRLVCDTLRVAQGSVDYTEVSAKHGKTGTVPIRRLTLAIYNLKNVHAEDKDSLRIHANGYLLDTVWVRLRVKESFTDPEGGFLMTLRLKPGNLQMLNPVLEPLANVRLLSGELDTLSMRAVGREYLALGEMKMFYSGLRIQILKNGEVGRKTLLTRLGTFVVNTFIIRRNNQHRTGYVFYIRQRDRSAVNYLVRIAVSGMASSTGAKNNRKQLRRYNHELEKRKLPPPDMD